MHGSTGRGWKRSLRPPRQSLPLPPSRLVEAFDQVVEPLITEITCLRSHELRLFHLVSAYIGSPPGELRASPDIPCGGRRAGVKIGGGLPADAGALLGLEPAG